MYQQKNILLAILYLAEVSKVTPSYDIPYCMSKIYNNY